MTLFHGSNTEIIEIDLNKCRPRKDFGQGIYLTDIADQAMKMANRVARIYGGKPVVTCFEADIASMLSGGYSVLVFEKPDIAWATFVMNNRSFAFSNPSSMECNLQKQYDLVIGPVANDDLALLFRQFEEGLISIDVLTREMTYKRLTSQYSFHTQRAVEQLKKAGVMK